MLLGVTSGIISAWLVFELTRPSTDDLQRRALDELGLAPGLESAPFVEPVLDEVTERVSRRVIDESASTVVASAAVGVIVAVTASGALMLVIEGRGQRSSGVESPDAGSPATA